MLKEFNFNSYRLMLNSEGNEKIQKNGAKLIS